MNNTDLTGLCITDESKGLTVNIHSSGDPIRYGIYDDSLRSEIDQGCRGLYRTARRDMINAIRRAVKRGAVIYTLLHKDKI